MIKQKKIIFAIWLVFLIGILLFYFIHPEFFAAENLKNIFFQNIWLSLLIYFILGTLRGFTLLPSTPMVLAGILVFPAWPLFLVNLICVFTSSSIVYYWGKYLEFDKYFEKKYPNQLHELQSALKGKEIPVITLWSFFPFVPTDLICYTSEIMQIKIWKCLLGVAIGEGIICAIYIFGGIKIINVMF